MALLTLPQYWTDEVARRAAALAAIQADLTTARGTLAGARSASIAAGAAERAAADAIVTLRRQLAAIPLPADGDPLLIAMNAALVAQAKQRVAQSVADLARREAGAAVADLEAAALDTAAALDDAKAALTTETTQAAARQAVADRLTAGDLMNLVADAAQALTDFEAAARAKVEPLYPSNAAAAKDFLKRVRDRRDLVSFSARQAAGVLGSAALIAGDNLADTRAAFDTAAAALRVAGESAPRLAGARSSLERLAGLSAPLITPDQSAALLDASKKAAREAALVKLRTVDLAERARRLAEAVYDQALYQARKTDPDSTQAALDAGLLKPQADDLVAKADALSAARLDLAQAERDTLDVWFAAVPEAVWQALEEIDAAVATLNGLQSPTPAALIADLAAKEDLLAQALAAAHLTQRQTAAKATALATASAASQAESATAPLRARAMSRSAGVF
jgi:hypothetical protein